MTTTTTSPEMAMPVPNVAEDPGPDWATNLDACLSIIDSHDHSAGKGAAITGPIVGSPITGATIDSSAIGGTTPAAAAVTQLAIGSGPTFKMQRFTGSLTPSGTVVALTYTTAIFGVIGFTTYNGVSGDLWNLGVGIPTGSAANVIYPNINVAAKQLILVNADNNSTNTYDVTAFYI